MKENFILEHRVPTIIKDYPLVWQLLFIEGQKIVDTIFMNNSCERPTEKLPPLLAKNLSKQLFTLISQPDLTSMRLFISKLPEQNRCHLYIAASALLDLWRCEVRAQLH